MRDRRFAPKSLVCACMAAFRRGVIASAAEDSAAEAIIPFLKPICSTRVYVILKVKQVTTDNRNKITSVV